jgi:hypothetical protein
VLRSVTSLGLRLPGDRNAIGIPAAAITSAIGYLAAIAEIVSTLSNGNAEIAFDLKNANTRVVADSAAFFPDDNAALRLPSGKAMFFFVPDPDRSNFVKTLGLMAQNNQRAVVTSSNGLVVQDQNKQVVQKTPYAVDPKWQQIGPLDPFTIVVLETYVEMVSP